MQRFGRFLLFALLAAPLVAAFIHPPASHAQGGITGKTDFRKIKPPEAYGTVVMEKTSKDNFTVAPVVFPHWVHRSKYTCSVCHVDLGFPMSVNTLEIKQAEIAAGKYCGKCHNGIQAFAASECNRCHSFGAEAKGNKKIDEALKDLPKDDFGNRVNWAAAVKEGKIKPSSSTEGRAELKALDLDVIIPVTKFKPAPPDVLFPHGTHTRLLECSECHPSPFKDKKGGNPDMNMLKIISGQYCGVCHARVSFPLDDCFRCHSQPAPVKVEPKKEEKKEDKKDSGFSVF